MEEGTEDCGVLDVPCCNMQSTQLEVRTPGFDWILPLRVLLSCVTLDSSLTVHGCQFLT